MISKMTASKKYHGEDLMKKSDIVFIEPDTKGAPLDRYYIYDFAKTTEDFLAARMGSALNITSKIDNYFYINICSAPLARFFKKAFNIQRGSSLINMRMQNIDDMFYILIKTSEQLELTNEDEDELIELARSAGFYISINSESGAIIAKCETEGATSIAVQAITVPCSFIHYLEIAFDKDN